MKNLFAALVLLVVAACTSAGGIGPSDQSQPPDPYLTHLRACQLYADVLREAELWQRAGKLDAQQDQALRNINNIVTPMCLTVDPDNTAVVDAALAQLKAMLLESTLNTQE